MGQYSPDWVKCANCGLLRPRDAMHVDERQSYTCIDTTKCQTWRGHEAYRERRIDTAADGGGNS